MNANLGVALFPYPFTHPDTGEPLNLGTVTTTLAGTASLVATFADAALTTPNTNPLTLDASGYAVMFFSPLNAGAAGVAYDIVVKDSGGIPVWTFEDRAVPVPTATGNMTEGVFGAGSASTLTIAGGSITPTKNVHLVSPEGGAADNLDTIATTGLPNGARLTISNTNGSAAITVRNNQGNISTSDGTNRVLSTTAQRLSLILYGSNWFEDNIASSAVTQGNSVADGRLTLTTGVPVTTSNVTAAGTVYYTPYKGNAIDLYDGVSAWTRLTFSELSLALTLAADGVADLFVYNNGGVATLVAGTAWTNATTRALGLTRQNGVLVLASDTRFRYVGSVGATGSANQTEDSFTSRLIWNYYNRVPRPMRQLDATVTWVYSTATYRQANGSASNQLKTLTGIAEDLVTAEVRGRAQTTDANTAGFVAIGVDSTTAAATGCVIQGTQVSNIGTATWTTQALLVTPAELGRHLYVWLEQGSGSGTWTWVGNSLSGLTASVWG